MTQHSKPGRMVRSGQTGLRDLDQEFVVDSFKPLSRSARARWLKAKRKRGRPREGKGARVISVSVEKGLLARADKLAKKMGVSRARLIAMGIKAMVAAAD